MTEGTITTCGAQRVGIQGPRCNEPVRPLPLGLGDSNSSISVPIRNLTPVQLFFSQRPTLSPPKILTFPVDSPCIYVWNRPPSVDTIKYSVPWNSSPAMTLQRDTYETAGVSCTINMNITRCYSDEGSESVLFRVI
jgi:hypothetical protein